MGALCSCFHVQEDNDDSSPHNCLCPKCFFKKLKNNHVNLSSRGQTSTIPPPNQQASSSNSEVVFNNSSEANVPVINNSSSRHLQEQFVNEAKERQERLARVQPEPAGQREIQISPIFVQEGKICKFSGKALSSGLEGGIAYIFPSSDDEDVCPTCLEEYSEENPKIVGKCSHHYHLSCIYEWMERSPTCPVCSKLMLFDE